MPEITLPDDLREGINDAFGSEIHRQIGRGNVDAYLTCENDRSGSTVCVVQFKSHGGPEVSYRAEIPSTDASEWVPLRPEPWVKPEEINLIGLGRGELALKRLSELWGSSPGYRVVLTPRDASAVYMALEAVAQDSEPVRMDRGNLWPSKYVDPSVNSATESPLSGDSPGNH